MKSRLMRKRLKPFAETGAASSFKRRIENHSAGITDLPGVNDLGDLTPFQNQVLDAAEAKEQEEKRKQQEEARNQHSSGRSSSRTQNSRASNNGMGHEETIRYVNKSENPDFEE